ncbi:NfeD family protein [Mycoavidus sp. B2-EB]|uniref:NfeD family protein n=1 Tax=Mycoavidus sp. B2-EB TaxID=2651972 RepID=UPI001625E692|nr:NfeD family protein [Mycoavidus sp. B2-EB]BBO59574.1 hypothetical protein MPB2EB_0695 [Mycoavidus sp. B2-EB]
MMQASLIWWLLAGGLVIAELLTGTFYLLMVALGCLAGGVMTLLGFSVTEQLAMAAAVALSALLLLRRSRLAAARGRNALNNPSNNLDLGAFLQVEAWQGRRARALYRGAQWDVELAAGENIAGEWYEIKEMRGNLLIVVAKRS